MSKYLHEYNKGRCKSCEMIARFGCDEASGEMIKIGELLTCGGCKAVQYCSRAHQKKDWPKHKKFCKKFSKIIKNYKEAMDEYKLAMENQDARFTTRSWNKPIFPSKQLYPLHDFVEAADWQGLKNFLLDNPTFNINGGNAEIGAPEGPMSPLVLACGQGQIECAHILINHGADCQKEDSSDLTPLIYASWWGHDDIVGLLLNHGADVNQLNTNGLSALGYACQHLQPHVVELLLRHGADVNVRSQIGWTILMHTVCLGCSVQEGGEDNRREDNRSDVQKILKIVRMLLGAGVDVNARCPSSFGMNDREGDTALNLCCSDDKVEVMKLLIQKGALLDVQRLGDGRNALLAAAEHNEIKAVELLIRSGADRTVRDSNGRNYTDLLRMPWEGKMIAKEVIRYLSFELC